MRYSSARGSGAADQPAAWELEAWRRRTSPPENEVPTAVPVNAVLGRGDDVAVAVIAAQAYTTGLSFVVAVRMRTEPRGVLRYRMHDLISGHWRGEDPATDQRLLLGVEYADGRTATNLGTRGWPAGMGDDEGEEAAVLRQIGGGGGGRSHDQAFWLTPLPPSGSLVFVCAWPAFGVPESHTAVDGASVAEAGSRVEVLWPWEPDDDQPDEPPEPRAPTSGWFADALRRRRDSKSGR